MTATEVVRAVLKKQEVSQKGLAARLNMTAGALNERLRGDNLTSKNLGSMLRALDYKVVAIPRGARMPKDGYEVW